LVEAPGKIIDLVEKFGRDITAYRNYNEEQIKNSFINPFFKELGWDVYHENEVSPYLRDVVFEDSIEVEGGRRAPDYCFTLYGRRMFFVEAKKPSLNLESNPEAAYQLRRYAWSANLPVSILTDFEEFVVYEGVTKPKRTDRARDGRIKYLTFEEYVENWDYIYERFSRDAVKQGSIFNFSESFEDMRGTAEVDDEFLSEIEKWRELLAKEIAIRNPSLEVNELNFAVQQIIDRIIFMRMGEARGIEKYGQLKSLIGNNDIYESLCDIWKEADEKYNSGLFHFSEETDRITRPDTLTPNLIIRDRVFKQIIKNLYYPESPYEFSVLPPEILGNVYEQFLGKVIRLTPSNRAKVEEKPEVRRAGGVYYTPPYIVDYMIKNTLGKLCKDKTPQKVSELRVLDSSCGSGSFLLGAFSYLLNWHIDYYINLKDKNRLKNEIYEYKEGEWRLTIKEKKRILINNIFGVDIDHQAVEVTKLSLLLKVLEGENKDVLEKQKRLFKERALPDLDNNIKCFNSLIGSDFCDMPDLDISGDEIRRINPFDWHLAFPEIMSDHKFDLVIGNPPWGSYFSDSEKKYLQNKYLSKTGSPESHLFFIEKSVDLLNENGILGYITPNMWLYLNNSKNLKEFLLNNVSFLEISELSKYIFDKAPDMVPIIFSLMNIKKKSKCIVKRAKTIKVSEKNFKDVFSEDLIGQDVWKEDPNFVINLRATKEVRKLLLKIKDDKEELSNLSNVIYGIKTGNNPKYISSDETPNHTKKALKTGELVRYNISFKNYYLWWCEDLAGFRRTPLEVPKIVIQYIRKLSLQRRLIAAMDAEGAYYPLNNYSYITDKENNYSLMYLLGIINSNLMNFYFANKFIDYNIKPTYIKQLPIRKIDFNNSDDVKLHDEIVNLVKKIVNRNEALASARIPQDEELLQRQITIIDRQIDDKVYKLYKLTPKEIKLIEEIDVLE